MAQELRFRQVHLDFHTSEHIMGIGAAFDPDAFAETLVRARVNSITCFARCHHGWMYYLSEAFPDRRHPHLRRDLLREQIEACHKRGIRVPIYTTVQWDHQTAELHPEWLCVGADGRISGTPPYEPGFYRTLCLNTAYVGFLRAHVDELLATLPVDGLFFDIVQPQDCSCAMCRADMRAAGIDPSDGPARRLFGLRVMNRFKQEMTRFVRERNADCTVFYNAGHVGPRHRPVANAYTHFELESLPSGGWGYLHFPMTSRYARTLGLECLGMTGKLHTSWGDFQSFKNQAALEYECFLMLALNAKCSVGDQLPPDGRICPHTYDLIGGVYREVERREPWCAGARPVTEIAVMNPEAFHGGQAFAQPEAGQGVTRILQEGRHQFDLVDAETDLSAYRVLVLPDEIPVDSGLAMRIDDLVEAGGSVLASYHSGLTPDRARFALDGFGLEAVGEAPYSPDFIVPGDALQTGLRPTEYVMYLQGMEVRADDEAEALAQVAVPYFNRTHAHFCSHRHTPSSGRVQYPGAVRKGRMVYLAHPVFTTYQRFAPLWCKRLVLNALELLLPDPLVRVEGPSALIATLNAQDDADRWVLHLLYYVPERRGTGFDTIEDVTPLDDVAVTLRVDRPVRGVRLAPQAEALPYKTDQGRLTFRVPRVLGHQMAEVQFG